MEIYNKRIRYRQKPDVEVLYNTDLQFYTQYPDGIVSIKEFDEFALERLKILRAIERINLTGEVKYSEEWLNKLYDDFQKNKYFIYIMDKGSSCKKEDLIEARRKDTLSHFILRLAYCRNEDLRRWFLALETDLFRLRFMRATLSGVDFSSFLKENNLHYQQISEEEIRMEGKNLVDGTYNLSSFDQLENKIFFKVPFLEAVDLVRNRKVFLKNGFAYVPSSDLVSLVCLVFRSKLSQALALTYRGLPQIDDDERLLNILQDFDKRYTGPDYSQKKSGPGQQITPQMINHLSTVSFPLCMRQMQEQMNVHHHLKHSGRMQYGLFLKAAGLTLEDALKFWRSHFVKIMDVDKFDKQYAYNIRHNYGKEGKRVNYTPYGCMKIITSNVAPGDCHGCPFKHSDSNVLKQKLINYNLSQQAISNIMDLVSRHHYQIACQKYFEEKHKVSLDCGINHPNQYLDESIAILNGNKTALKSDHQNVKNSSQCSQISTNEVIVLQKSKDSSSAMESMLFDDDDDFNESVLADIDKMEASQSS